MFSGIVKAGAAFLASGIAAGDEPKNQERDKNVPVHSAPLNPGIAVIQQGNSDDMNSLKIPPGGGLSRLKNASTLVNFNNKEANDDPNLAERFSHIPQRIKDLAERLGHPLQILKRQGNMWTACPDATSCIVVGPHILENAPNNSSGQTPQRSDARKNIAVTNGKLGPIPDGTLIFYENAKSEKGSFRASLSAGSISSTRPGIGKIEKVPYSTDLIITVDPTLKKFGVLDARSCINEIKPLLIEIRADLFLDSAERERKIIEAINITVEDHKGKAVLLVMTDAKHCPPCIKLEPEIERARKMLEEADYANDALILVVPLNIHTNFENLYKDKIPSLSFRPPTDESGASEKVSPTEKRGLIPEALGAIAIECGYIPPSVMNDGTVLSSGEIIFSLIQEQVERAKKK